MSFDGLALLFSDLLRAWERGDPHLMAVLLILGSLLLYALASNLAFHYRSLIRGSWAERVDTFASSLGAHLLYESARIVYYLGLPYAALIIGWLDLRALGLGYVDWADGLRWTIVLGLASWSLLMFVWVPYLRATGDLAAPPRAAWTWARRVVETILQQAHWAFYRAALILLLSSRLPEEAAVYWGTCVGFALAALEAWSDPRVRRQIARLGDGELALWSGGQLIINAVGFVVTRNIWLLGLLQLALEFTVPHLRPAPRPNLSHAPQAPPVAAARRDT